MSVLRGSSERHRGTLDLPWRPAVVSPERHGHTAEGEEWQSRGECCRQRTFDESSDQKTGAVVLAADSLSPYCQFDKLDRARAEKLLRDKKKQGMYLIREGLEGLRVLSVWLEGGCYHYMIYRKENGLIFLTKSQLFSSLQELLQYYTFQANLPQMEHYLRQPYQPAECQIPDLARNYGMHTSSSSTASHHLLRSSGMPRLKNKSAPELLDDKCRFSGWIRKQGGGHKNWKHRYLILRAGCLYYFSNETASSPKGKFALVGYHVAKCPGVKKFPHMLKLEPVNPLIRTYFIACSTSCELERWKFELEEEIDRIRFNLNRSPPNLSKSSSMSSLQTSATSTEQQSPIQPRHMSPPATTSHHMIPPSDVPRHVTPPLQSDPTHIYDEVDYESDSDSSFEITEPADYLEPQTYVDPAELLPIDNYYTRVIGDNSVDHSYTDIDDLPTGPALSGVSPQSTQDYSLASSTQINHYLTLIDDTRTITQPVERSSEPESPRKQSAPSVVPAPNQVCLSRGPSNDSADYYIVFPTPNEALPPSCMFGELDRTEADRLLRSKNEEGTYLIREGSAKSGSHKVLTVWHDEHCRHYKLFKHEESYWLTQGESFNSLPVLIQHYHLQAYLPKSDFYLKMPYRPN